jgi:class 3 adenylate cyclase
MADAPELGYNFRTATGLGVVGTVSEHGEKAGFRLGDRIVKANDRTFDSLQEFRAVTHRLPGEENTYLVQRENSQTEIIKVVNIPRGFKDAFNSSGYPFLCGLCYIVIGVLVFLMKPHQTAGWIFFLFTTVIGFFLCFLFKVGILKPAILESVIIFAYCFLPATLFHLAFNFPAERGFVRQHPHSQLIPYLASALLFLMIRRATSNMADAPKLLVLIAVIYLALGVFFFIGSCLHLRLTSPSVMVKLRSGVILLGMALAASGPLADYVSNALFGVFIFPGFNYYLQFFIVLPVCIAYPIIKHNLFDIDAVIRRTYGYILITCSIAALYTLLIFIPKMAFASQGFIASPAYPSVIIVAAIFIFNLSHHRVRRFVDRVFFRLEYDYQATVRKISETMASLLSLDQIRKSMMDVALNVLFVEQVTVMLFNPAEKVYADAESSSVIRLPAHDPLIQKITEVKKAVTIYDISENPIFKQTGEECRLVFEQLAATLIVPLIYEAELIGILSLGKKKSGKFYRSEDINLLTVLANQGAVAVKNASSYEHIKRLNVNLEAAVKKIEILESIKTNLSKFVPTTVTKLIEKSPSGTIPESKNQDVSVLFVDIAGYTKLSEKLDNTRLNDLVEKYFSIFMEAIYANNGDVNETTGDGLMVLFLNQDQRTNAADAVRAALTIRHKAALLNREAATFSESLTISMGINSGEALLGAAKFESQTGDRWTYTARGMVTNVAARITGGRLGRRDTVDQDLGRPY